MPYDNGNITRFYICSALGGLTFFHGVLAFYMRQIGFSYTQIFILVALYEILVFLLEIPTGMYADRFGLKRSVVLGHLLSAASCFPVALFPASYGIFLLWSVLSALCTTLNSGSVEALQYHSLRDLSREAEYTTLRGRLAAIGGVAMPVGAFAGGVFCETHGFGRVVALGGLTGLVATAFFVSMSEPRSVLRERDESPTRSTIAGIYESIQLIKRDKELAGVIVAGAVVYAAYYLINNYSQPCLEQAGILSYRVVGVISGTLMVTLAAVSWLAGYLKQRVGETGIFVWLSGVPILSLVGLGKLGGLRLLLPLYFSRLGEGVADPVISDRLLRKSPPEKSATLLSTQSLLASLLLSLWSMGTGLGLDHVGSFFTFTAGAGFAFLLLLWFGRWALKPHHQTS
ncbi:MAG: MFS transporter [Candidatus Poribacteria bacterium]|nr:MFS transporter [Candidatus Poribacteria bacterium]MDE0506441.1 MFS transporter [Candidatus Poribacteria bacterium]